MRPNESTPNTPMKEERPMRYRPKGWENPYPDLVINGREYGDAKVWEDGADTMLEALTAEVEGMENPCLWSMSEGWRRCQQAILKRLGE